MARVSDAFPALISVKLCSACGKVPELCGCSSVPRCADCWLPIDWCYCDDVVIAIDETDIEPLGPPPLPGQQLVPCLSALDEDWL